MSRRGGQWMNGPEVRKTAGKLERREVNAGRETGRGTRDETFKHRR